MKFLWLSLIAAFTMAFWGSRSFALDIYSFIDSTCSVKSGLIVGIDETSIKILGLDGRFALVPKKSLTTIAIFSTLQNPIPEIKLDENLAPLAKEINVNEDADPLFVGWPIRFIEDLVIFYDTSGKIHVLELADITKIRDLKKQDSVSTLKISAPSPLALSYNDVNSQCTSLSTLHREGIGPTRIMSDKISVSEFLSNFENGFRRIDSYEERTLFYAKPYLFEKRSKLGLLAFNSAQENIPILPIYFQWSSGKPYGFQSFNIFGSAPAQWIPTIEPISGFQSDLKSHFFNASFIGNILALPAGSSYYINGNAKFPKDIQATSLFNYMALLGADYGPYSFSFGTYFPLFGFHVKNAASDEIREVLASSVSPAFRFMFTKGRTSLHAVYSATQVDGGGSDGTALKVQTIGLDPDHFYLLGSFVRAGFNYQLSNELKFGVDEVYSISNYNEVFGSTKYFFNSTQFNTAAYIVQSFGYYISVKVYFNFFDQAYNYNFINGVVGNVTNQDTSIGGAFEFVF